VPAPGGIAHATDAWEEPAGGGAVAAVQLARLCGSCTFYTAFGDDERGEWSRRELERLGVRVEAAMRPEPTRRAVTLIDADGERTIATLGVASSPPAADRLAWNELEQMDAAYVTAGNAGALREARRARVLVATAGRCRCSSRPTCTWMQLSGAAGTRPSASTGPLTHPPHLVVHTDGTRGGRYETSGGRAGRYEAAAPPGPVVDTYGAGDSFAAGVTYALAAGLELEAALELAARCGAWCVSGRGPYGRRLPAGGPG
jgi:ribokinase